MSTDLDPVLGQLHRRILGAIGLSPVVVGLSLAGCATESGLTHPDRHGRAPAVDEPAAPAAEGTALAVRPVSGRLSVPERPEEPIVYAPVVAALGTVTPGHVIEVVVTDVPPGASVAVLAADASVPGEGLALVAPWLLGEVFAGSEGTATLQVLVPVGTAIGALHLQAIADDGEAHHFSAPSQLEVVAVVADYPLVPELHPATPEEDLVPGARFRSCIPAEDYSADYGSGAGCPEIADFHEWQALEVVAWSLDRPLAAEVSALACLPEGGFPTDCCYVMELWDTLNGSPADACIPPAPVDGGGGGGGGGGWGWEAGRPFVIGAGGARLADVRVADGDTDGWCAPVTPGSVPDDPRLRERVVQAWIRSGQAEHASVASFARFVLELVGLGAPADLVARATRAQADEIRHARDAFGVAAALSGVTVAPGPLSIDGALERSAREVLLAAVVEGCINETVCAVQVQEASRRAADPELARILAATADDEMRHAELSWAFVRWMLDQHPELRDAAREAFTTFSPGPVPAADDDAAGLAAWGVLSDRDQHAIAVDVLARVVVPSARSLLGAARSPQAADLAC